MKIFIKNLIFSMIFVGSLGFFVASAYAAPLEVTFTPDPLFQNVNFLPSDETTGEVSVTNNTGGSQTILTEAINITDNDNFSNLLHIVIKDSDGVLFENSLKNFLSNAGEVSLGSISNGETRNFDYIVSFTGSDNSYQGKTLGFDVCVGFEGGSTHCGDTSIGGEHGGGGGGGGGGTVSGGGGGSSIIPLTISNEQNQTVVESLSSMLITWVTNKLATSQVVYGPDTSTYTLDLNDPNFGYPFGTVEDPIKVLNHSVLLTGLIPGQTYLYRVVSRASPPTVSPEHQFTMPTNIPSDNLVVTNNFIQNGTSNSQDANGSVLGASIKNDINILNTEEGSQTEQTNESDSLKDTASQGLAFVLGSQYQNIFSWCSLIAILLLILAYLLWVFWIKEKYENSLMQSFNMNKALAVYLGLISLVLGLIAVLVKEYCYLPVFVTVFALSLLTSLYQKFKQ